MQTETYAKRRFKVGKLATDNGLQLIANAISNSDTVQAQKKEIQEEGQRVLNTIPHDYQKTLQKIDLLNKDLDNFEERDIESLNKSVFGTRKLLLATPIYKDWSGCMNEKGEIFAKDESDRWHKTYKLCSEDTIIKVKDHAGGIIKHCIFLDRNNNVISTTTGSWTKQMLDVAVPSGAKYVVVNATDSADMIVCCTHIFDTDYNVAEKMNLLKEDLGDSLGYKYYNIKPLWTNGWFYSRDGSLRSDSHASYTKIEVEVGEKYHIVGYNGYHSSLYSLRDSNKDKITTYPDSSDTNYEKRKFDECITIPEGVKYLCVSKWDSFGEMLVEKESYTRVTDINTRVTDINTRVTDIDTRVTDINTRVTDIDTDAIEKITEFHQIGNDTMEVGWVRTDKKVDDAGEASTARHLTINNIIGRDTYRYTANGGSNCHAVLWFDDIDSLISYVPFSKTWSQETVEVTAPANAVKAIVNSINTSKGELVFEHYRLVRTVKVNPIIEKRVTDIEKRVTELEDGTIDSFEYENIKKRVIENQIKNDFAWGEFDGLYATITFDDTNADIDQLQDLAEELSIPFCYATIPSKLENITSQGTETAKQVLERAVANGGEVLSHWGSQLNSLSKDEDYYNVYAGAKKALTENGFEVNGIITAGGGADGTPESFKTQNFLKDIELARIYYKYADLTANDFVSGQDLRYIEQFYNNRTFTDRGVDAIKYIIDSMTSSGKGWLNLASHGTNNANTPTIDSFRQIFQHAINKGFTFVTWNTMYKKFKSSKLEKRVKALELN